jgi:biopolymer transport protein ExbD
MAGQERVLDVWLVDLNEVYSAVPFTVVADWLQQGRLLAEDRVRLAGNKKWHTINAVPAFAPYLPHPEPLEAQDQAEALEPVELGLDWGRPQEEEDEDVDMIPLIDISLVLLIFFMMTASVSSGMLSPINTPAARHQLEHLAQGSYWVGVDLKGEKGVVAKDDNGRPRPWYSLGKDRDTIVPPTTSIEEVTAALAKQIESAEGDVKISLRAERSLTIDVIRDVTAELQGVEAKLNREAGRKPLRFEIMGEVSEPQEK